MSRYQRPEKITSYKSSKTCDVSRTVNTAERRAIGGRQVHRVTFAEDENLYVNCDTTEDYQDDVTEIPAVAHRGSFWDHKKPHLGKVSGEARTSRPTKSIIKLQRPRIARFVPEDSDNPFVAGGELRRKADSILRHSTFSRTCIQVFDPDCQNSPVLEAPDAADMETESDPLPPEVGNDEPEAFSDVELEVEPSVTTLLVSQPDHDLDLEGIENQFTRSNGKHSDLHENSCFEPGRPSTIQTTAPAAATAVPRTTTTTATALPRTRTCRCCSVQ